MSKQIIVKCGWPECEAFSETVVCANHLEAFSNLPIESEIFKDIFWSAIQRAFE